MNRLKNLGFAVLVLLVGCSQPLEITSGTTYVRNREGQDEEVRYTAQDGLAVFEGDIILGTLEEAEARLAAGPKPEGDSRSAIVSRVPFTKWADGIIPYMIDPKLDHRERVLDAIAHWEKHTKIRFVRRTDQHRYVTFQSVAYGCSSAIGRSFFPQNIRLSRGCSTGAVIHEIGHSVGLWHEQSRGDRDDHITIHWENIEPGAATQFFKQWILGRDLGPYDANSVMHYDAYAFSKNHKPTITLKDGSTELGQREALSPLDVRAVEKLYR